LRAQRLDLLLQGSHPFTERLVAGPGRRRDVLAHVLTQRVDLLQQGLFQVKPGRTDVWTQRDRHPDRDDREHGEDPRYAQREPTTSQ
jgi:hypothetical protein